MDAAIGSSTHCHVPVASLPRGLPMTTESLDGKCDQDPSKTVNEFARHHVQGDIVEAGLVNSTYEGSTDVTFVGKVGIVTCIQNNPQICLHAKPTRTYYVKLWLVDTGCGHDLVSLKSV